jgi:PhnB protein
MGKVTLDPYLFFTGNCREAMEFYEKVFGGTLEVQTYDEVPGDTPEGMSGKVMHASLRDGEATLYGSDTTKASARAAKISLCIGGSDEPALSKIFEGLSEGAEVNQPLKKEFWGDTFGGLTDRFGVDWMVNIAEKKE